MQLRVYEQVCGLQGLILGITEQKAEKQNVLGEDHGAFDAAFPEEWTSPWSLIWCGVYR
jgi:hypothetical protein